MKKHFWCLMLVIAIILAVPVNAVFERTIDVVPDIEFDGTSAMCTVRIMGDRTTDKITATMKLWQGNTLINDWSASGSGILKIDETATVKTNKTYKLTVEYTINGEEQTPISITRTNG